MSLLFCDSFDHYNQASGAMGGKWTNPDGVIIAQGRNGQGCLLGFPSITTPMRGSFSIGWAIQGSLNSTGGWGGVAYQLSANNLERGQDSLFQLTMFPNGTFGLLAGNNWFGNPTTFIASTTVWIAIGLNITLGSLNGFVTVGVDLYVNGNKIFTNMTAPATSNVTINDLIGQTSEGNTHTFGAITSGVGDSIMDDVYILDNVVLHSNNPNAQYTDVGDVGIYCIFPRADVLSQWSPSSGSTRWNLVKEVPPDGDNSYIFDDNPVDKQTFFFDVVGTFNGQIKGVQMSAYARKDNEGSRAIADVAGSGSYVGPTRNDGYLGDSYTYYRFCYDVEPQSAAPWTPSNINAQDFGVETAV